MAEKSKTLKTLSQNQLVEQIVEAYRSERKRFCFILGAGASVESGIPTGNRLEMKWMDCLMGRNEDPPAPKKLAEETREKAREMLENHAIVHKFEEIEAEWRKEADSDKKEEEKSLPSKYYFDLYSLRFAGGKGDGYWYLEDAMEGKRPSVGYHTLALLLTRNNLHNLVITTNFDSLVEDALFLYTDKKPMVAGHESLAEYIEPNIQRPIVAKVHRSLFYEPINTPDHQLAPQWEEALQVLFASYTPIVIGYGGGDHSLMSFLEKPSTKLRHGLYWCCRKGDAPDKKVSKLIAAKDGFQVSIQGFDALMLDVGMALFPDEIIPAATEALFSEQSLERLKDYRKQWNRWRKDNNQTSPETVSSMNRAEQKDEQKREERGELTARDYTRRGDRQYFAGNYTEAIADYSRAINLKQDDAYAYYSRGAAYNGLGQYENAVADCSRAIELKPDYAYSYDNRGFAYDSLGQYEKAIADYSRAIELAPNDEVSYINRSATYNALGQHKKAVADCNKAIELKLDDAVAYNNRGFAYQKLRKYDKAIPDLQKSIKLDPNFANPHRHLGNIFAAQEKWEAALKELSLSIVLMDDYIEAYRDRAEVYRQLGESEKAAADEAKATELEAQKKDRNDLP